MRRPNPICVPPRSPTTVGSPRHDRPIRRRQTPIVTDWALPLPTVPGIPAGTEIDGVIAETRRRHADAHGHELTVAIFADTTAEAVSGVLDGVLGELRPDLVVYEATNVGAAMAADVHDVPAVAFDILINRSRPAVYLTLGTVSFGAVEVVRRAVDQIARLDVDVLVAVGPDGDPVALGEVPGNVHVERFVPQARVFGPCRPDRAPRRDRHRARCGRRRVAATDPAAGRRPVPQRRPDHAGRRRPVVVDYAQEGGAIADAVSALLGDCPERARTGRLRVEIASMPAPEGVVPELERLAGGVG